MSKSQRPCGSSASRHENEGIKSLFLSNLEPGTPRATVGCVLRHYAASMFIYTLLLGFIRTNPWFSSLTSVRVGSFSGWDFYWNYYLAYAALAPVGYLLFRPRALWKSKNVMILSWLGRLLRYAVNRGRSGSPSCRPTFQEKNAAVFLLIKLIYGPLMLNGLLESINEWAPLMAQYHAAPSFMSRLDVAYNIFVYMVFLLDISLFCFGYHAEATWMRNQVRFVETSVAGLVVCLICYPPFNQVTCTLFGSSNDDPNILFQGSLHHPVTWILRGVAVFALLLLTSASFSLFTKASNLTNRGIVRRGPYALVRHPGYVGKNLFWLTTIIPIFFAVDTSNPLFPWGQHFLFCLATLGGYIAWCSIYVLRALTEEKLLMQDPEYVAYCQKVRYRFIPWVC